MAVQWDYTTARKLIFALSLIKTIAEIEQVRGRT